MIFVFLWLISLSTKSIHVVPSGKIHFLWLSNIPLYTYNIYIYFIYIYTHTHIHIHLFIRSSFDGHLGCFHTLAIVNNAAVSIEVNLSFQISVFVFLWKIPRNGTAGLYGTSLYNFFRNIHTVFHSGCTNLHSYQQCTQVPLSPPPRQHLLFIVFLITTILIGVRSYLTAVLICITLMISDVEHLFTCLLASCMSSLEKCLFGSSADFKLCCLMLSCMSSLYTLDINPLSGVWLVNIFSHSVS